MKITPEAGRGEIQILAEGRRLFWATAVTRKVSRNGNQMIVVKFLCVYDELTEGKEEGKTVWENFVLTQNAAWKLRNMCFALKNEGFDADDIEQTEEILTSKPVYITVRHDTYTDDMGNDQTKPRCGTFDRCSTEIQPEWEDAVIEDERKFQANKSNSSTYNKSAVPF